MISSPTQPGVGEGPVPFGISTDRLPRHVAVIMDGNGRWASERGLPRHAGHRAGVQSVRSTVERCVQLGIPYLTLFAFSSENWKRPRQEVSFLMELFITALRQEVKKLLKNGVRLRVIGDLAAFPIKLREHIHEAERITQENLKLQLLVAANYGGRWDLTQAARRLSAEVVKGRLTPEQIDENTLSRFLAFAGIPDPDLYIRTGGEQRLSNFLLWQAAYAELYFTKVLWPDFDTSAFDRSLMEFAQRERRFGQVLSSKNPSVQD